MRKWILAECSGRMGGTLALVRIVLFFFIFRWIWVPWRVSGIVAKLQAESPAR
jgi:hypothetical protein